MKKRDQKLVTTRSLQRDLWLKICGDRLAFIALIFICMVIFIALFAPLLASNKPYYFRDDSGRMTYPILGDLLPSFLFSDQKNTYSYPEFVEFDFRKIAASGKSTILMPPIPYSPTEYDLDNALVAPQIFPYGRSNHLMGTDEQGRDIASRMIHGARVSLSVGFIAVAIYVILGIIIGAIAGFFGGWVDLFISRVIEIVMCFPTFLLMLTVLAFIGQGLTNIMLVIGFTSWTGIARLVRGEFLRLKNLEYIVGARALGLSTMRLMFRHFLPNALSPVLVSVTFGIASSILIESSLSFLGFGVQPPDPSWGDILNQSHDFIDIAWWLMLFPGAAIFLSVTAFNLVGEAVRDALDPRST